MLKKSERLQQATSIPLVSYEKLDCADWEMPILDLKSRFLRLIF